MPVFSSDDAAMQTKSNYKQRDVESCTISGIKLITECYIE